MATIVEELRRLLETLTDVGGGDGGGDDQKRKKRVEVTLMGHGLGGTVAWHFIDRYYLFEFICLFVMLHFCSFSSDTPPWSTSSFASHPLTPPPSDRTSPVTGKASNETGARIIKFSFSVLSIFPFRKVASMAHVSSDEIDMQLRSPAIKVLHILM